MTESDVMSTIIRYHTDHIRRFLPCGYKIKVKSPYNTHYMGVICIKNMDLYIASSVISNPTELKLRILRAPSVFLDYRVMRMRLRHDGIFYEQISNISNNLYTSIMNDRTISMPSNFIMQRVYRRALVSESENVLFRNASTTISIIADYVGILDS